MAPKTRPSDVLSVKYASNDQVFIIPLTFNNILDAKETITRISYGGDVWELRVDLLSPEKPLEPNGDDNLPPPDYVREQIQSLQAMSALPILFTIRTRSQGGRFPDAAADEALALWTIAIDEGVEYIDVEIEWPQTAIEKVLANKKQAKVVASYHSWTGQIGWSSRELQQKYAAADAFGDINKLSILSTCLEDCFELGLFVAQYKKTNPKPLLAVGMGAEGQLSRITSPISLVTHPLIPFPSAPGQLSLAQVHRARHLMGQLPKLQVSVSGDDEAKIDLVSRGLDVAFQELGYPHEVVTAHACLETSASIDVSSVGSGDPIVSAVADLFQELTGRPAPVSVIRDAVVSR